MTMSAVEAAPTEEAVLVVGAAAAAIVNVGKGAEAAAATAAVPPMAAEVPVAEEVEVVRRRLSVPPAPTLVEPTPGPEMLTPGAAAEAAERADCCLPPAGGRCEAPFLRGPPADGPLEMP